MQDKDAENVLAGVKTPEEEKLETTLRPQNLDEFIGQKKLKENLKVFIEAAKKRKAGPLSFLCSAGARQDHTR